MLVYPIMIMGRADFHRKKICHGDFAENSTVQYVFIYGNFFKKLKNKTVPSEEFENTFWYFDNFKDRIPITIYYLLMILNKFWYPLNLIWMKNICVTCQQIFNDFKNLILRIIQKMYLLHCTVQLALMRRLIKKRSC